ncbi:MAG: N-formylglutamate amidohydrolase [Hyphomicrobiales bacterium]
MEENEVAGLAGSGDAVELINPAGAGNMLIVCEHASSFIPDEYNGLGLDAKARESHIAWDPGALAVAKYLAVRFDAPLIAQRISRLVYDCNRIAGAHDAIPEKSEIYEIPGNADLSADERRRRLARYYLPFHDAIAAVAAEKSARGRKPLLVTVHSFAPVYFGRSREVEVGVLHDEDARLADALIQELAADERYVVRRNEPYGPEDGVTHTLIEHGISRGLANVMLEIRNNLIADENAETAMADWLGDGVERALARLGRLSGIEQVETG